MLWPVDGFEKNVKPIFEFRAPLTNFAVAPFAAAVCFFAQPDNISDAQSSASVVPPITAYRWRPVAIGGGGFITGYDVDPAGKTRLAKTDVYGAYVWSFKNDRWVQLVTSESMPTSELSANVFNQGVYAIAVAPSKPDRIYMAIAGFIYRSDNAGKTFLRSREGPFPIFFDANSEFRMYGPLMAVSPLNANLVLMGTPNDGLLRSQDGGITWATVGSVPDGKKVRNDGKSKGPGVLVWFEKSPTGHREGNIWALSYGNGMFHSTDGGLTFTPLYASSAAHPNGLRQGTFSSDGSFYGVDSESQSIWKYRDSKWSNLSQRLGLIRSKFATVAIDQKGSRILLFDEGGSVQISLDGGQSWKTIPHSSKPGSSDPPWLRASNQSYFATSQVRMDPIVPGRFWAATGTGIYYADVPTGASEIVWSSQTRGIEELVANDVIHPPGGLALFGGWDFGVHVKGNLDMFSTTYGPEAGRLMGVQQLDWSPSRPNFIVTNASDTRMHCCDEDGNAVMAGYSFDGGQTWTKFATLPTPPGTSALDPWRMAFGSIAVSATDIDNIVWMPSMNRAPFFTKDLGATWNRVKFDGEVLPNTGAHAHYNFQRKIVAADRVLPYTFYLVHSGNEENPLLTGLWRTTDGGSTWQKIFKGEISPFSGYSAKLRGVPERAGNLFFSSGIPGRNISQLMRSLDGGKTWTMVANTEGIVDVGFGEPPYESSYPTIFIAGYVSGKYGIWRSIDNAATWIRIGKFPIGSLDAITCIEGDKNRFGRVYVGFEGSGWKYGEPSNCTANEYAFGDQEECFAAR
jgi:photosystem II stability/assembly factor-like uncharacterized protein